MDDWAEGPVITLDQAFARLPTRFLVLDMETSHETFTFQQPRCFYSTFHSS